MLIGRPGAEPEIKTFNNNKVARFRIAVKDRLPRRIDMRRNREFWRPCPDRLPHRQREQCTADRGEICRRILRRQHQHRVIRILKFDEDTLIL